MNLQQFYATINGNYDDVVTRFGNDTRILKFIRLFPADTSYALFNESIAANNKEDAFRAIHTLKGIILNLGFSGMYPIVNEITELLRNGNLNQALPLLPKLHDLIELHYQSIDQLLNGENE